jgi:predicted nuclease of predicted toxin-antitoxin system
VKLLFDENLSPNLPLILATDYAESVHVRSVGLLGAHDQQIWNFSRDHGFTIVSKDTDFRERSLVEGFPPKVLWLNVGNAGTAAIAELLMRERGRVEAFGHEAEASFLILSLSYSPG